MNTVLKNAYGLERKGLEFYIDSATKSKNSLVKKTLFSLAQEEINHMMKIDEVALSLDASGKWPDHEIGFKGSDIEIAIKGFFENAAKEMLDKESDNAEILKKAMEFERKSYELYSDLAKRSESDEEKKFYEELKEQENAHYAALENVYYYLTKTGDWFGKEESRAWNWMNL